MKKEQRIAYLALLVMVANLDGNVSKEEKDFFEERSSELDLSTEDLEEIIKAIAEGTMTLEIAIASLDDEELAISLMSEIITLCWVDGDYSEDEKVGVAELAKMLDVSKEDLAYLDEKHRGDSDNVTPEEIAAKKDVIRKISKGVKSGVSAIAQKAAITGKSIQIAGEKGIQEVKNLSLVAKEKAVQAIDQNGNGDIDIEDIIILSMKTPGIRVNREKFLRKELSGKISDESLEEAIANTPSLAGVDEELINQLAEATIQFERYQVTGISTVLGVPGGLWMAATIPADLVQYYGYMLRAAQKLMYLYGFPEIMGDEDVEIDTATINLLTICIGVMYGVVGANNAIKGVANALAKGVAKKIMKATLKKTTWFPVLNSVGKWFGVNVTKKLMTSFVGKAIPLVGGIIGGGITFVAFKPCCERLKDALKDSELASYKIRMKHINDPIDTELLGEE